MAYNGRKQISFRTPSVMHYSLLLLTKESQIQNQSKDCVTMCSVTCYVTPCQRTTPGQCYIKKPKSLMLQCLFFNKHNSFHAVLIFPLTLRKLIQRHFCSTRNIKSTQHTALNLTARQFNETPKLNCYNWKRNCGMKLPQCFSFRAEKKKQSNETKRDQSGEQRKNVNQNFLRKNFF